MLVVLSGLPGVGKTTRARELARRLRAVHVRVDSIEQALRPEGLVVGREGYAVAHAVAADNLRVGRTVVADCVNPWPLTRAVAEEAGVPVLESSSCARVRTSIAGASGRASPPFRVTGCRPGRRSSSGTIAPGIVPG